MGQISLPQNGMPREDVLNTLKSFKSDDVKWHEGQLFGLIYEAGPQVEALVKEASALFLIENGLSPMAFPSLVKMETEVVSIVISLSGGDEETVGSFTSGGTESIFMALKAARDWARHTYPRIKEPEMVVPVTAHPAWNKAAHYLGVNIKMTPVKDDLRADVAAMKNAITKNTIILGGSAVTYPHGMVDPIEEIGALAETARAATQKLIEGINAIPQLYVLGDPDATVFAFGSDEINIYELSARMAEVGWHIEAQQLPPSLHMTVSPVHLSVADKFLDDLRRIAPEVPPADSQDLSEQAAMYAMLGTMPDRSMAREFAVEYFNNLYRI